MHVNSHCLEFHSTVLIYSVVLLSSCFTVYPSSFSFFPPFPCACPGAFSTLHCVIKLIYQKTEGYGGFGGLFFGFALCDGRFFIVLYWFIVQLLGFTVTAGIT